MEGLAAERGPPLRAARRRAPGEALSWFREARRGPCGHDGRPRRNMLLPSAAGVPGRPPSRPAAVAAGRRARRGGSCRRASARSRTSIRRSWPTTSSGRAAGGRLGERARRDRRSGRPGRADVARRCTPAPSTTPASAGLAGALRGRSSSPASASLPAILGMERPARPGATSRSCSARRSRGADHPPSVPGMRLQRGCAPLRRQEATSCWPVAAGARARTAGSAACASHRPTRPGAAGGAVVLATGGFASGGIELDSAAGARNRRSACRSRAPESARRARAATSTTSPCARRPGGRRAHAPGRPRRATRLGQPARGGAIVGRRRAVAREVRRGHRHRGAVTGAATRAILEETA